MPVTPFVVTAEYPAIQHEREDGTFRGDVPGYRIWSNRTSGRLVWHLPGSARAALGTLRRGEWTMDLMRHVDDSGCDSYDDFDDIVGIGSSDFAADGTSIIGPFSGSGTTEVVRLSSDDEPDEIVIAIEGQEEELFDDVSEAIARIEELLLEAGGGAPGIGP